MPSAPMARWYPPDNIRSVGGREREKETRLYISAANARNEVGVGGGANHVRDETVGEAQLDTSAGDIPPGTIGGGGTRKARQQNSGAPTKREDPKSSESILGPTIDHLLQSRCEHSKVRTTGISPRYATRDYSRRLACRLNSHSRAKTIYFLALNRPSQLSY